MHEEDDWPRRGGRRRVRRGFTEPAEPGHHEEHDHGGPWGPPPPWDRPRRMAVGPMRHGPGWWMRDEPRRRPRVRRGDVRAAALALLGEEPRNGYQIIQEIAARSGGVWQPSPGSVYPALQQLEDEGLVRADESAGKRTFVLTDAGRTYVAEHEDEISAPWESVAGAADEGLMELHDVIRQVGIAAMQVAQAGTDAQAAEARRILTDARRALYWILAEDEPREGETGEA